MTTPRPGPTADDNDRPMHTDETARPGVVLLFSAGGPVCRAWPIGDRPLVLGRGAPSGVIGDDDRASREHAEITWTGATFRVRDLGSRNGTFVAGQRLTAPATGDRLLVRIGQSVVLLTPDARGFLDRDQPVGVEDGMVIGPALRGVLARVARTAAAGEPLLVTGESGSGKELIARRYHASSPGADGPFIAVNSAAIPEAIAERVLFGTVKGAYSGAASDAPGFLTEAHGGTLFLDELGELPAPVQAKLLRVLETREVTPVGGTRPRPAAFGLVTATNRDVRDEIARGQFRADLYYRVGRVRLSAPPLRDRIEEIPWLIADELRGGGAAADGGLVASARLVETCCLAPWPGNLRELRSEIRAAALTALAERASLVTPEHLSATAGLSHAATPPSTAEPVRAAEATREALEAALQACRGNVTAAARTLHVHRNQVYRLMERYGIDPRAAVD